jgi:prepilin-type N-terminal cleavage/methylation domain-containing protein
MRRLIADQRGLTLAEVLIAMAILGLGLLGLLSVIPGASSAVQQGNQLSTAIFLAQQMIERSRAATWTGIPAMDCLGVSAGDVPPVPTGATCFGATATQFPDQDLNPGCLAAAGCAERAAQNPRDPAAYRRTVRVTDCGITPCAGVTSSGMRRVRVTVSYRGLTAAGMSAGDSTVTLDWVVAQK